MHSENRADRALAGRGGHTAVTLILVFAGCFGLLMAVGGGWLLHRQRTMEAWPTVEGRVLSSEIQNRRSSNSKGGSNTMYAADVHYA